MARLITTIFLCSLAFGCQSTRDVSSAYRDATYAGDRYKTSDRTSVLFLVDGLSSEMLTTALRAGTVPQMANAFTLSSKARFPLGRAQFPSLTFPNITSVLTNSSVADHAITGNRVVLDGRITNFENVSNWPDLARTLQRRTVFAKLSEQSESSVSYAYAFSGGATAYLDKSIEAGFGYLENDYASIDSSTLLSLKKLLVDTPSNRWPRFIFVHLIGVDAIAHKYGPTDERVQTYLEDLDANLGEIFAVLDHPEGLAVSNHSVNYALTADHGFRATPLHSPLADVVANLSSRKLRLIPDNRIAPLWFQEPATDDQKLSLVTSLVEVPHVGLAVVKSETALDILRRSPAGVITRSRISFADGPCPDKEAAAHLEILSGVQKPSPQEAKIFTCLSQFDRTAAADDDYQIPALVDYFANPESPDAVFIADENSDFADGYAGNHGGLTREEMLVPVLTKDVELPRGVSPTYKLLEFMGVTTPPPANPPAK